MIKRVSQVGIFCLLLIGVVNAIAQPGPYFKILRDDYSNLGTNTIGYIKKDKTGLIWLLGFKAIVSYDGKNYKHFPLPEGMKGLLIRLYQSPEGGIIVQDQYGQLFYLDGEQFTPHPVNEQLVALNTRVKATWTVVDSNYVHMVVSNHYIKIDSSGEISYPLREKGIRIHGLGVILRNGKEPILINGIDTSLGTSTPKSTRLYNEALELMDSMPFTPAKFFYPADYTQLSNGNYLINLRGTFFECNDSAILRKIDHSKYVSGLLTDSRGGLWISTNDGLEYYPDQKIDTGSKIDVISNDFCVVREEDYQGGIWIHANESGTIHIPYPQYSHYSDKNYLSGTGVRSIQLYHDTLFYAANNADYLFYIDQKSMDTGRIKLPMRKQENYGIIDQFAIEDQFKLWVSERGNLFYRERGKWGTIATEKLEGNNYFSKYYLQDSGLDDYDFAGFHRNQYFLGNEDSIEYISQPLPDKILSLLFVGDSTFIGTINGLYLKKKDSLIPLYEQNKSLASAFTELAYFDGKVWLSSYKGGLLILSPNTLETAVWKGEQIHVGSNILKENEQYLWAIGSNFSFRYERGKGFEYFPYIPVFSDGNQSAPTYFNGSIYAINATKGVLKMDFDEIADRTLPLPLVYFDEIKFDTTVASLKDSVYTLAHTNNSIRISYAGINFLDLPIEYRYRLGENEGLWENTNGDDLFLVGLSPGKYQFELQTRIGLQDWCSSKKLTFIITPPVWQEPWFIILAFLLLVALVFLLVRNRIYQIRYQNKLTVEHLLSEQRTLRAKLDPHFVFNIISSAQSLILREHKEKAAHFLQLFSKQLRNVLDQSDKSIYTISDEIKMLKEYIDLEFYRSGESFHYTIQVDDSIEVKEEKILPLIIQPFVENAILHGLRLKKNKGELHISFNLEEEFLKIVVQDNGIGREAAKRLRTEAKIKQQSHGINICKERLALHNKQSSKTAIEYEDLQDEKGEASGTQVTINMKRI